jgi:hypothetical protein
MNTNTNNSQRLNQNEMYLFQSLQQLYTNNNRLMEQLTHANSEIVSLMNELIHTNRFSRNSNGHRSLFSRNSTQPQRTTQAPIPTNTRVQQQEERYYIQTTPYIIDYIHQPAATIYGIIGIKVWLFSGES